MITVYYNNVEHKVNNDHEIEFNRLHTDCISSSDGKDLPAIISANGSQFWYKNGLQHRDGDSPAVILNDGSQLWYKNGKKHRDNDLPAEIWDGGTQEWYKNGLCHRDGDLPASIWDDETQFWYKNGLLYPLFSLKNILFLQYFIRIRYISRYNKIIWSPNNLAGIYTKNDLYSHINKYLFNYNN